MRIYFDTSHPYNKYAMELYKNSVRSPTYTRIKAWDSPQGGWNFLTSQIDYLRNHEQYCVRQPIQLICYERLGMEKTYKRIIPLPFST